MAYPHALKFYLKGLKSKISCFFYYYFNSNATAGSMHINMLKM